MATVSTVLFVFFAGLMTALATGLGAIPFFLIDRIGTRWNVALWGLASGIMIAASVFGLLFEGIQQSAPTEMIPRMPDAYVFTLIGAFTGIVLVLLAHNVIETSEIDPRDYEQADVRKLVLILGVLTVHSFPEGVAVGVSFAELNLGSGPQLFGFVIPVLGVFMTVAISIHNIPEGIAISIPLRSMGVSEWRMVWWAVFSSLPQPIGAVIAFYFVRIARQLLPFGFGFAAGAMIYLVVTEFIPEALEIGSELPRNGHKELASGVLVGILVMIPLLVVNV